MSRQLEVETRLLYAENLAAFLILFSQAMASAEWHADAPAPNRVIASEAWHGLELITEQIYEHLKSVHAADTDLSVDAPDVDAVRA